MPSKKNTRKQREKMSDDGWRAFTAALEQFKKDGTGSRVDDTLLKEFPLFHGKAPPGHPYPQAFTEGAAEEDDRAEVYYRPENNSLLDQMDNVKREVAFWTSKQGLLRAFPNSEVLAYTDDDIKQFCDERGMPFSMVKIYA